MSDHSREVAARPGVPIVFKSRTWLSLNPVLTPKLSPSRRRIWQQWGPAPAPAHHGGLRRSRALRRAPNQVPIQMASPVPAPLPGAAPWSWHSVGHSTALTTLGASPLQPWLQQEHGVVSGRWDQQFGFSSPQAMQSRSAGRRRQLCAKAAGHQPSTASTAAPATPAASVQVLTVPWSIGF